MACRSDRRRTAVRWRLGNRQPHTHTATVSVTRYKGYDMPNFSHATVAGHLTRDPEVRYAQSGTQVTSAGIAVSHWTPEGQDKQTSFFDIVVFGNRGNFLAEHTRKGDAILVSGELRIETWQRDDGSSGKAVKIVADRIVGLGAPSRQGQQPAAAKAAATGTSDEDDLPF